MSINAKDFVQLLRVYKHDYLNHLQVVSGYLQLKKPELALQYVREAIEDIQENGTIMRLELPELVVWLFAKQMELEELGVSLNLQNDTEFSKLGFLEKDLLNWFESAEKIITDKLLTSPDIDKVWEISFDGNGPFEITLSLPVLKEVSWPEHLEAVISLLDRPGIISSHIEEEEKFVYKLLIPTNLG